MINFKYEAIFELVNKNNEPNKAKKLIQDVINVVNQTPTDYFAQYHAALVYSMLDIPKRKNEFQEKELFHLNKAFQINNQSVPVLVRRSMLLLEQNEFILSLLDIMKAKQLISTIKSDEDLRYNFCTISELKNQIEQIEQQLLNNNNLFNKIKDLNELDVKDSFSLKLKQMELENKRHTQLIDNENYHKLKVLNKELLFVINNSNAPHGSIGQLNSSLFKKIHVVKTNLIQELKENKINEFNSSDKLKMLRILFNIELSNQMVRILSSENESLCEFMMDFQENNKQFLSSKLNLSEEFGYLNDQPNFFNELNNHKFQNNLKNCKQNNMVMSIKKLDELSRASLMLQLMLYTAEKYNQHELFLNFIFNTKNFSIQMRSLTHSFFDKDKGIFKDIDLLLAQLEHSLKMPSENIYNKEEKILKEPYLEELKEKIELKETSQLNQYGFFNCSTLQEISIENKNKEKSMLDKAAELLIVQISNNQEINNNEISIVSNKFQSL